ncbi:MAG: hypothetical protein OIF38_15115 [Cellvibrionaceae bacterium]|nr:hypothetical protein [Cellvibrionaceae bacterium]
MRLGKLAAAIGFVAALSSPGLSALGLGEIKLNSTLNQPLDAEIKLLQAGDLSESEILANLATVEDFSRAGIERNYFLTGLKFKVDLKAKGGPILRVTSEGQVQEPYLNFLVETRWPNGRMLREYTLLMDLPIFAEDATQAVQPARSSNPEPPVSRAPQVAEAQAAPKPQARPQPQPEPEPEPQPEPEAEGQVQPSSSYGPVAANDTLWAIASQVRPSKGMSIQQTMLAIQRLNPDAFINGNINLLRRGQVLRIPTEQDITQLSNRQAVAQVAQQNAEWSGAAIDASPSGQPRQVASSERSGQVKLASGGSGEGAGGSGGSGGGTELTLALEQLDKSRRENEELQSRIADLEAQIETMERLVAVSDEQMRALQLAASQNNTEAASEDAEQAVIDPLNEPYRDALAAEAEQAAESESAEPAETAAALIDDSAEAEGDPQQASAEVQQTEADAQPEPKKVASVVSKPADPSFIDTLMDNLLWIGGALVAILVAVWALLRGRRKPEEEDEPLVPIGPELDADDVVDEEQDQAEGGGDVVADADMKIAYGKLDEAEALLRDHLAQNPGDQEARLKLLEVYSETHNFTDFDEEYSELLASGEVKLSERGQQLRDNMGDPAEASDALDALGLDLEESSLPEQSLAESDDSLDSLDLGEMNLDENNDDALSGEDAAEDLDFSIDLSDPFEDQADSPSSASAEQELSLEGGLDLGDDLFEEAVSGAGDDAQELEDFDFDSPAEVQAVAEPDADLLDDVLENSVEEDSGIEFESALEGLSEPEGSDDPLADMDLDNKGSGEDSSDGLSPLEGAGLAAAGLAAVATLSSSDGADEPSPGQQEPSTTEMAPIAEAPASIDFSDDLGGELDSELDLAGDDFDLAALDQELEDELNSELQAPEADPVTGEMEMPELDLHSDTEATPAEDAEDLAALDISLGEISEDLAEDKSEAGSEIDEELDFLAETDEVATKLDLARAYMDMGDKDGAKEILEEVLTEGDAAQRGEAEGLIERMAQQPS